jgi:four helix bundle protein
MDLIEAIYEFTGTLPRDERFGLSSQLQRAAVSVPANLAEGQCRRSDGAFLNHVSIAIGSQAEVETLLEACRRLRLGDVSLLGQCERISRETGKMLYGLHASLQRKRPHTRALLYSKLLAVFGLWLLASAL